MKEFAINGIIQIPEEVSEEVLVRKFLDFIESNGFRFAGAIKDYEKQLNDKDENDNKETTGY